jgi:hypothetical protein
LTPEPAELVGPKKQSKKHIQQSQYQAKVQIKAKPV